MGQEPVLICGAGPTGLVLALECARFGVPFRLIDRAPAPANYSQALVIQARTLELLEPSGATEELSRSVHRVDGLRLHDGSQSVVDIEFAGMPTAYDYVAVVPQQTTEAILYKRLVAMGGALERRVRLTDLAFDADGVTATLETPSGTEQGRFSYVAACDGAHSTVRKLRDLTFTGHALRESFMLADLVLDTNLDPHRISIHLRDDGSVLAFIPIDGTNWRMICESPHEIPPDPQLADFQAAIEVFGLAQKTHAIRTTWTAKYSISQRKISHYRDERAFFLGDAAHIHSPIGGQGMNAGIQDAINLAWKLALVLRDGANPKLLDTYAKEREPVARGLLRLTDFGNRVLLTPNPVVRTLRDRLAPLATRLPQVRNRMREAIADLRIAYPTSPLSVHGRTHHNGTIAGARLRGWRPATYHPQVLIVDEDADHATTIVVRPDGYAGYVIDGVQQTGAELYLRNVIGLPVGV
jgi:2-polyprenyl-6-methoxyphenol hydroxylase-like FAD-dependent oxidoreductase